MNLSATFGAFHPVFAGFLGSLAAGAATILGAVPALFLRNVSAGVHSAMIGFAAGVMLAATFFSLIVPGLAAGAAAGWGQWGALGGVSLGIAVGTLAVFLLHDRIPHEHLITGAEGPPDPRVRRIWLFVFAVAIHNVPEGFAVGAAFGGGDLSNGAAVSIGIGLQNIPEGLAVAVALVTIGVGRWAAVGVAALTGLIEPIAGLFGAWLLWLANSLLPLGLGFAAGAMLFVISAEMIPETHRGGGQARATLSLVGGFLVMMALDVAFG